MPLYSIGLTADSLEFEFEDGSATGSDLDFGIHDNIENTILNNYNKFEIWITISFANRILGGNYKI